MNEAETATVTVRAAAGVESASVPAAAEAARQLSANLDKKVRDILLIKLRSGVKRVRGHQCVSSVRLLRLSDGEQEKIEENGLTERHARALLRLEDEEEREEVLSIIIKREMNVSRTEEYIEDIICAKSRLAERESKPKGSEQKRKLVIRDIRLFYNSIDHAVDVIKKSGIPVESTRKEVEEGVLISILLPKKAS